MSVVLTFYVTIHSACKQRDHLTLGILGFGGIGRRVGEHETLYGSVTSSDVADALETRQLVIDRRKIQLHEPLKRIGDHEVPVRVHRDVTATVKVKIVPLEEQDTVNE